VIVSAYHSLSSVLYSACNGDMGYPSDLLPGVSTGGAPSSTVVPYCSAVCLC
jgi:hypothetical protein